MLASFLITFQSHFFYSFIILISSCLAIPDGPISLHYDLLFLNTAKYPLAVCNDGSPGAIYLYKGSSNKWVVHQQGGWWCWDDYSCQVRWDHFSGPDHPDTEHRTLMSTISLANLTVTYDTFNGEKNTGLMQHNPNTNPDFYDANKVFVVYCSSDSHSGNTTHTSSTSHWHFRGKEIIQAVISELAASHNLANAELFLLTGGSAGGMATFTNSDWVRDLLYQITPTARFIAYPDSGMFLDVKPHRLCDKPDIYECKCAGGNPHVHGGYAGGIVPLSIQMQRMIDYTQGIVDETCAAFYGKWGHWRCYLGEYAARHVESTFLIIQMQIDEWQGFWDGFSLYASDKNDYAYATWFRERAQRTLSALTLTNIHVFSPNCYIHGIAYNKIWWSVTVSGLSARDKLSALVHRNDSVPRLIIDDCYGLPCSTGCK